MNNTIIHSDFPVSLILLFHGDFLCFRYKLISYVFCLFLLADKKNLGFHCFYCLFTPL